MTAQRRARLVDCNPRWGRRYGEDAQRYITFNCPEGHPSCWHTIPFTPALDGKPQTSPQLNGAQWERIGEAFEALTLMPSIRRIPVPGHNECALHIFVRHGQIEFCEDSR